MSESVLYYLTGGGTGGHLFPGLTLAGALAARNPNARLMFVGSNRPLEQELVAKHGYAHRGLPVESLSLARRNPLKFFWRNWRAYRQALDQIRREQPAAVIGLGGYASFPLVLAACRLDVPTLLLEQNVWPGRTTRWLSRLVDAVCVSFPETIPHLSSRAIATVTGNPVRPEIAHLPRESKPEGASTRLTLLVLGGSQGAATLNEAVARMLELRSREFQGWRIVHQTGPLEPETFRRRYAALGLEAVVEPFFTKMESWYREASLVISRAGATTLAELAFAGVPAVLVPYPQAADNHQLLNAQAYESAGAAKVILQRDDPDLTAGQLGESLAPLLSDPSRRAVMSRAFQSLARADAAARVIEVLDAIVASRPPNRQKRAW